MAQTLININGDVRDASSLKVPQSRTFRGAWQYNGSVVEVNMVAARNIHRDNLRIERKPLLDKLDVDWFRAVETGGDTAVIAAKKQALRDITEDARIEAATTPEELEALTIDVLLSA